MANRKGKGGFKDNPQNINKAGAPKRGESWKEIISFYGNMTPTEAAERAAKIARELRQFTDAITLKEAVVLRGYLALLNDPQPGLLNAYMDRDEGKVAEHVKVSGDKAEPLTIRIVKASDAAGLDNK
jgi:hypothetical protein